jgi:hypothetical protein
MTAPQTPLDSFNSAVHAPPKESRQRWTVKRPSPNEVPLGGPSYYRGSGHEFDEQTLNRKKNLFELKCFESAVSDASPAQEGPIF